jgi:hypothetical protein
MSSNDEVEKTVRPSTGAVFTSLHVTNFSHIFSFEPREEKDQEGSQKHNWKIVKSSDEESHDTLGPQEKVLTHFEVEESTVKDDQLNKQKKMKPFNLLNSLLTFVGIAIAAIIGVFIRIGFGYYKIWKIDTNYVFAHPSLSFTSLFFSLILFLHLIIIIISHPLTLTLSRH